MTALKVSGLKIKKLDVLEQQQIEAERSVASVLDNASESPVVNSGWKSWLNVFKDFVVVGGDFV